MIEISHMNRPLRSHNILFLAVALTVAGIASPAGAQDAADYFRDNCTSCHTICPTPNAMPIAADQ